MKLKYPEELVIGFQERADAMTGKLSYIVYKEKNKLKKEKSFNNWIDKKIDLLSLKNEPREGFLISKSVRRDTYYFGSGRSMIRMYDPEGFDFEITVENLEYILQNCDTNKGEFEGKFCYMWDGAELVLVPENSEAYVASLELKSDVNSKVEAKNLKVGAIYKDKKTDKTFTYLGRYDYYKEFTNPKVKAYFENSQHSERYNSYRSFTINPSEQKAKKQHIFFDNETKTYVPNATSKLAYLIADEDENYQTLITEYFETKFAKKRKDISFKKVDKKKLEEKIRKIVKKDKHTYYLEKDFYVHLEGNYYARLEITAQDYYQEDSLYNLKVRDISYYDKEVIGLFEINARNSIKISDRGYYNYFRDNRDNKEVLIKKFEELKSLLPNFLKHFENDELDKRNMQNDDFANTFSQNVNHFDFSWLDFLVFSNLEYRFKKELSKSNNDMKDQIIFRDSLDNSIKNLMSLDLIEPVENFENK